MSNATEVQTWLHSRKFVLWDMDGPTRQSGNGQLVVDGPLLSLFHGYAGNRRSPLRYDIGPAGSVVYPQGLTAPEIARHVRWSLQNGSGSRGFTWRETADPFQHLHDGTAQGPAARDMANLALTQWEMAAVPASRLGTRVAAVTQRLWHLGVKQAVATNNAELVAHLALARHGLNDGRFQAVVGRDIDGDLHLKPEPHALVRACAELGIADNQRSEGAFVEDSVKNVAAGLAAGIPVLGITGGDPDKARQFLEAGAQFAVPSVAGLWIAGRFNAAAAIREQALGQQAAAHGLEPPDRATTARPLTMPTHHVPEAAQARQRSSSLALDKSRSLDPGTGT
ncbi:HAD family hydrolase [Streptodolium elevatio]